MITVLCLVFWAILTFPLLLINVLIKFLRTVSRRFLRNSMLWNWTLTTLTTTSANWRRWARAWLPEATLTARSSSNSSWRRRATSENFRTWCRCVATDCRRRRNSTSSTGRPMTSWPGSGKRKSSLVRRITGQILSMCRSVGLCIVSQAAVQLNSYHKNLPTDFWSTVNKSIMILESWLWLGLWLWLGYRSRPIFSRPKIWVVMEPVKHLFVNVKSILCFLW